MISLEGSGAVTVKSASLDVPPPGEALATVILNTPALIRSWARITAVNLVDETKVVALLCPWNLTDEEVIKLRPFTVMVN